MKINYNKIAKKIEDMIKADIRLKGLVKTGRLVNSIKVSPNGSGGFKVIGEDYFTVLDQEHNITKDVFSSPELKLFIEKEVAISIAETIKEKIK